MVRRRASVTLHNGHVHVAVEDQAAVELVDRALLVALLEAGVGAEKEGPHVTTATMPALCFGKVKVSRHDEHLFPSLLAWARDAAVRVLTEAGCEVTLVR